MCYLWTDVLMSSVGAEIKMSLLMFWSSIAVLVGVIFCHYVLSETCQQSAPSQSISAGKLSGFVGRKIGVNLLPALFHLILFQRWRTHRSLIYKRSFNINEHPAAISRTLPKTVFLSASGLSAIKFGETQCCCFFPFALQSCFDLLPPSRAAFLLFCIVKLQPVHFHAH